MAKNWYDKHDIEERFGWTFRQFKTRLSYLDLVISSHYQGGNGKAYKVDENGFTILDRQYQLEKEGQGVKEAARIIISEFENKGMTTMIVAYNKTILGIIGVADKIKEDSK